MAVTKLDIVVRLIDQATKGLSDIGRKVDDVDKGVRKLQKGLLGSGLSFLFTGMAIKRVFDGILKSIFNTYQLATDSTSEFDILTNRLIANWEFFKFTLVDALMQTGLFQSFIGFLIDVIKWFSDLSPKMKEWLVIFAVVGSAIGGVLMVVGQLGLGLLGLTAAAEAGLLVPFAIALGIVSDVLATIYLFKKAFDETPEAANAAAEAMTPLKSAGQALLDSFNTIVDLIWGEKGKAGWSDFAWTGAWALNVIANALSIVTNELALMFDLIAVQIEAVKLLSSLWKNIFTGDSSDMDAAWEDVQNRFSNIKKHFMNVGQSTEKIVNLLNQGPVGFKEEQLANKRAKEVINDIMLPNSVAVNSVAPQPAIDFSTNTNKYIPPVNNGGPQINNFYNVSIDKYNANSGDDVIDSSKRLASVYLP